MRKYLKLFLFGLFILVLNLTLVVPTVTADAASKTKISTDTNKKAKTVTLTVTVPHYKKISKIKWAYGKKKKSYFNKSGKTLKLKSKKAITSLKVAKNGTYTFWIQNKNGSVSLKTKKVKNVDSKAPTLKAQLSTTAYTNENIFWNITASDKDSGIKSVKYMSGKQKKSTVSKKGTPVKLKKKKASIVILKNGYYSVLAEDKAGNKTLEVVKVTNIDQTQPSVSSNYRVVNQTAIVSVSASDAESGVNTIQYINGSVKDASSTKWNVAAKNVTNKKTFSVTTSGTYSIRVTDKAGNSTVNVISVEMEMKAVWIYYSELGKAALYNESNFQNFVNTMFDTCVDSKLNTVIVQVRPFGDALYKSNYFPWSTYISGTQGKNPGYDPLAYMVKAAHERNLKIHAWVNPYRISYSTTDASSLSSDNQARKWQESNDASKQRNVLAWNGGLYYNPSKSDCQKLIVNGVKEIVKNYDVDGIHFDDYFYPSLGSDYKEVFDAQEYEEYKEKCSKSGKTASSIVHWRRDNVSKLIQNVYSAIKSIDVNCQFGISPAGNIDNLESDSSYYVDITKWLSSDKYVDYICPQLYWGLNHSVCPYKKTLNRWLSIRKSDTVAVYVGLAAYRTGISESTAKSYGDMDWAKYDDILMQQVQIGRDTGKVDGYALFSYQNLTLKRSQDEMNHLKSILDDR